MDALAIITDGSLVSEGKSPANAIVPFYVQYQDQFGKNISISGQEVSQEKFLEIQQSCKHPPKTSQPNPHDFYQAYESLWKQGYKEFIVLTVPRSKSGTYTSATIASQDFYATHPEMRVMIVDSGTTVAGVKDLALIVRDMLKSGEPIPNIEAQLKSQSKKIEIFLTTDTIVYLGASGRVEELSERKLKETIKSFGIGLAAYFARVTHRSPKLVLTFKEGKEKVVTLSRFYPSAVDRMFREIEGRELNGKDLRRVYLYQSQSEAELQRLKKQLEQFRRVEIIEETQIPLALLATTGPKLVAAVCIYE